MKPSGRVWVKLRFAVLALFVVVSHQACQKPVNFDQPKLNVSGNGDPYTGKVSVYSHFDRKSPCTEVAPASGKILPNSEIHFRAGNDGQKLPPRLVRENCRGVKPVEIPVEQISFSGDASQLTYQNKSYELTPVPPEFEIMTSLCPAGKTQIPNARRTNYFADSTNWLSSSWFIHPGLVVEAAGSILSLPSYRLHRPDPSMLGMWRRASQLLDLEENTEYAFSFLVRPGTVNGAAWRYYRRDNPSEHYALVVFDLSAGTASLAWKSATITDVSATLRPVSDGHFATVYFRSAGYQNDSALDDVGVSPFSGDPNNDEQSLNDSIEATAAQLEKVGDFCQ